MPRRARYASFGAAAGSCLLLLIWFAAFHIGPVQRPDERVLRGFADLQHPHVNSVANAIAHLCDPKPYVYFTAIPVIVALIRRRPRLAIAIVMILLGANMTTQLLKPLLAHARPHSLLGGGVSVDRASWPSGHATAAMALALCMVLAAPPKLRPALAALGAAFAVAVSYAFMTLGWHYPSDVLGGFIVALVWTLIGAAVLYTAAARWPTRATPAVPRRLSLRETLGPSAAVVAAGLAAVGLIALTRPHEVISYARAHTTFIVGAAAIGTLALALATGLVVLSSSGRGEATGSAPAPTAAHRRHWHRG